MAHNTLPITNQAETDRSTVLSLFVSLRPAQWTKNLFVFGALLFGQRGSVPAFLDATAVAHALAAFAIFCGLSGVVYLIDVPISHWLYILIMLLALFLALSKRRHELVLLADGAGSHRPILQEYSPYLLDQMIGVVTASTLVSYVVYTVSAETVQKFHTDYLGLTLVFPLYGIFRYLYLVHQKEGGGSPSDMLQNDRPLLACVALWALSVAAVIYGTSLFHE
jgi:hypothetical protein